MMADHSNKNYPSHLLHIEKHKSVPQGGDLGPQMWELLACWRGLKTGHRVWSQGRTSQCENQKTDDHKIDGPEKASEYFWATVIIYVVMSELQADWLHSQQNLTS